MIEEFTKSWFANLEATKAKFSKHPDDYKDIVRIAVEAVSSAEYDSIDPNRIHEINDGEYQGTLVFVIAQKSYQPYRYWYVRVSYGSCSGCDALENIRHYSNDPPTESQISQYMQLALNVVQGLREMNDESV